jgi:hypothetical protein
VAIIAALAPVPPLTSTVAPITVRAAGAGAFLLPDGFFHDPQGVIKALEKFLKVIGKEDHRLAFKAAGVAVFAFHDVKVKVAHAVFLYVEKVGSVLQHYFCGE